jgi:probable F420-dependent oxidoreductase
VLEIETQLRCGITLSGLSREAALRQARRAEALGFDSLWATDHIAFHAPIPESLSLLAFAAAATERITLGTSVYLLALRPAVLAAKVVATVDALSGGRFVLGVGLGGEFPAEFDAVGVPVGERASRVDEAIPLLRRLWRGEEVAHEGTHARFGPIRLAPGPARAGGPPIWVGGRSVAALRRAARLGDGFISHMATPRSCAQQLETIAREAEAARRSARFVPAAFLFSVIDESMEAAHRGASEELGRLYRQPFDAAARRYCVLGTPADCLEQLRAYARAGIRHFILAPLGDMDTTMERAGAEILPELPGLLG